MDTKQTCKICNRSFANGKAMGGHMRSHLLKHRLPPKPIPPVHQQPDYPSSKSLSSSSSLSHPLSNKNSMQLCRTVNRELSYIYPRSNLVADFYSGDTEADSMKNPSPRRSKRSCTSEGGLRRSIVNLVESPPEQVSSTSDNVTVEDAAICLVMLSKGRWTRKNPKVVRKRIAYDLICATPTQSKTKQQRKYQYRCEKCNKGFRSHQALGGHKASHKRIKIHIQKEEEEGSASHDISVGAATYQRVFKCPFCDKVFESGQALGGHKKVHLSYPPNAKKSSVISLLDLNLPAPETSEDEIISPTGLSDGVP